MIDAYGRDERAANRRYDGKRLRVDGWLVEVSPGTLDNPMVRIGGSAAADPLDALLVMCRVTDDFIEESAGLTDGARIVVEGTCEGKRFDQVRLEDCEIVSPRK